MGVITWLGRCIRALGSGSLLRSSVVLCKVLTGAEISYIIFPSHIWCLAGQNTVKQARHLFFSMGPLPGARLAPSEHADFRASRLCTTAGSFQTNIPRGQGTSCCLQPFLPQFQTQLSFNERRHLLMRRVAYTHRQEELFGVIFR